MVLAEPSPSHSEKSVWPNLLGNLPVVTIAYYLGWRSFTE
jgi:hypothetical protein